MLSIDMRGRLGADLVLTLRGEIDYGSVDQLRSATSDALRARPRRLCLDLTLVQFIDSVGIGTLMGVHRTAAQVGCQLVVDGASAAVRRALAVSGVADELGLSPS